MAAATIPNSAGPGSTIQLAPETIRVRDAVIARCETQTLEQMNEFVKSLLANETDELKRLGVLAARVFILRQRIYSLGDEPQTIDAKTLIAAAPSDDAAPAPKAEAASEEPAIQTGWLRLRVVNECEVNGMRFFEGVIVDVREEDASRLIGNGNAEVYTEPASESPAPQKPAPAPQESAPISSKTADDSPVARDEVDDAPADNNVGGSWDAALNEVEEDPADEALRAISAAADKAEAEAAVEAAAAQAAAEAAADIIEEAPADNNVGGSWDAALNAVEEDPADEALRAISAAADKAEAEAAAEAAADIIDEAPADNSLAALDTVEIGVDSSDLEELAAFAGLTTDKPSPAPGGGEDDKVK